MRHVVYAPKIYALFVLHTTCVKEYCIFYIYLFHCWEKRHGVFSWMNIAREKRVFDRKFEFIFAITYYRTLISSTISTHSRDMAIRKRRDGEMLGGLVATELAKFLSPMRIETVMIWQAASALAKWKHAPHTTWQKQRSCRTSTFTRYNISRGGTIEQTNSDPLCQNYYRELYESHLGGE